MRQLFWYDFMRVTYSVMDHGYGDLQDNGHAIKETKKDDDYAPYDDDLYNSHDIFNNLQDISDELDITVDVKLLLVDDDEKPLPKAVSSVNANSNSEVEEVFDEQESFMTSSCLKRGGDNGYGTNNLWEQWKETKKDDDYAPYDDDLYNSHDIFNNLQDISDEFMVDGRKKK
nr:hypothetical protein [Tanacetum cinerariifolium]